jgi:hypothetical protein
VTRQSVVATLAARGPQRCAVRSGLALRGESLPDVHDESVGVRRVVRVGTVSRSSEPRDRQPALAARRQAASLASTGSHAKSHQGRAVSSTTALPLGGVCLATNTRFVEHAHVQQHGVRHRRTSFVAGAAPCPLEAASAAAQALGSIPTSRWARSRRTRAGARRRPGQPRPARPGVRRGCRRSRTGGSASRSGRCPSRTGETFVGGAAFRQPSGHLSRFFRQRHDSDARSRPEGEP